MLKIDVLVAKTEINSFGKVIKINVPSTITLPEIIIEYLRVSFTLYYNIFMVNPPYSQ